MYCFTADALSGLRATRAGSAESGTSCLDTAKATGDLVNFDLARFGAAAGHQHRPRPDGTCRQRACGPGQVRLERRRLLALRGRCPRRGRQRQHLAVGRGRGRHHRHARPDREPRPEGGRDGRRAGPGDRRHPRRPARRSQGQCATGQKGRRGAEGPKARNVNLPAGRASAMGHLCLAEGGRRLQGQAHHRQARANRCRCSTTISAPSTGSWCRARRSCR